MPGVICSFISQEIAACHNSLISKQPWNLLTLPSFSAFHLFLYLPPPLPCSLLHTHKTSVLSLSSTQLPVTDNDRTLSGCLPSVVWQDGGQLFNEARSHVYPGQDGLGWGLRGHRQDFRIGCVSIQPAIPGREAETGRLRTAVIQGQLGIERPQLKKGKQRSYQLGTGEGGIRLHHMPTDPRRTALGLQGSERPEGSSECSQG